MSKNKNNTKGGSGVNEWAALQEANATTGISLNDTNKFLKRFPNNPSALAHKADALANIAASKAAAALGESLKVKGFEQVPIKSESLVKYTKVDDIGQHDRVYNKLDSSLVSDRTITQYEGGVNEYGEPFTLKIIRDNQNGKVFKTQMINPDGFVTNLSGGMPISDAEIIRNLESVADVLPNPTPVRPTKIEKKFTLDGEHVAPEPTKTEPKPTPPKVDPPKVEQTKPAPVSSEIRQTTELKPSSYGPDDILPNRATFKAQTRDHVTSNIKRSNLIDKKAGLSSDLEKNEGSLKPITYTSLQTGETTSGEVHSSGNTTHTGQPVKNQITAERKAAWDTARELLDGSTRSSIENSGLPWTKFTLSTTPRTKPRAVYKDRQNSVPFKDYPQHGRIIPNTVVHKSKEDGGNAVINEGRELNRAEINEDFSKQAEEFAQSKPPGIFSKISPEEKARLTRLDELTAAFHGLNTNIAGTKGSVEVDRVKGLSTKVGTDDLSKIETTTRSPFPTQLTGMHNLEGSDLDAFKAAYNQDLELNRIGKQAGFVDLKDSGIYSDMTPMSIDPWAGSNQRSLTYGYGMGWGNMWRASAKDNAKRAITVVNPLSRGNMSLMGEQLGRVSTRDMLAFKANPTIMNRLGITAAPAFAAGFVGYGMYDNQDIGEIVSNLAVPALALPGARAGLAIGSAVTPAKTATNFGILRAGGMAVGATVGFVTGAAVALAATAGISDITSNESSIRKFASKMAKTEFLVPEVNSRQSLTARQMALNKLSKSGLNDRALLLGNEAAALGGYL